MKKSCFCFLVILLSSVSAFGASSFDRYPVASIAEVLLTNAPTEDNEYLKAAGDVFYDGVVVARSRVTFIGESRPTSPETRKFIDDYVGKALQKPDWSGLYQDEVLCKENQTEYWLPIQKQLIGAFRSEVARGASVDLFITFLGAYRSTSGELRQILTINEFVTTN